MNKKIIIFKNDRLGDFIHGVAAINNIIAKNPDKEVVIFLSKISEKFYFLVKNKNSKIKILNYNLTIFEKVKIVFYLLCNSVHEIYILSPKKFYFFLPLFFFRTRFLGICMNGVNGYRRPSLFLRKFLYKFVVNNRETNNKRKSIQLLQWELTNNDEKSLETYDRRLDVSKSDKLNKYLPKNYLLIHYKKSVGNKLGWGENELDLILNELKNYNSNVVLIKDIEKDETNLVYRKKYKTYDFESNLFYDNKSNVLFFDNIEGEDLYNVIKYSKKVIAFHGTITSIGFLNKISVLDLFYCEINNKDDYYSYKNAFYEFKPKYKGYDFIVPSKSVEKTIKKMKFALRNQNS